MKNYTRLMYACGVAFLCINMGTSQEVIVSGDDYVPPVSVQGVLTETEGIQSEVFDILVGGKYRQIWMYRKPSKPSADPTINITKIDLSELRSIVVHEPEVIHNYAGRDYIEVKVTYNDPKRTSENFIIERHKRVTCKRKNGAGPIEKDLSFEGVDTLTITGYKMNPIQDDKTKTKKTDETKSQDAAVATGR